MNRRFDRRRGRARMRSNDAEQPGDALNPHDLFVVTPRRVEGRAVLEIAGELDLHGSTLLTATAQNLLDERPRPDALHVDASGIEFIDSSGLATLLQVRDRARSAGIAFHVTGGSTEFRRIVGLTGLDHLLSVSAPPGD
jgi:anti-anti-sigma factor